MYVQSQPVKKQSLIAQLKYQQVPNGSVLLVDDGNEYVTSYSTQANSQVKQVSQKGKIHIPIPDWLRSWGAVLGAILGTTLIAVTGLAVAGRRAVFHAHKIAIGDLLAQIEKDIPRSWKTTLTEKEIPSFFNPSYFIFYVGEGFRSVKAKVSNKSQENFRMLVDSVVRAMIANRYKDKLPSLINRVEDLLAIKKEHVA